MHNEENKSWLIEALSNNYEANASDGNNDELIKNTNEDYYTEPIEDEFAVYNDNDDDDNDNELYFNEVAADFDKDDCCYDYEDEDEDEDEDDDEEDDDEVDEVDEVDEDEEDVGNDEEDEEKKENDDVDDSFKKTYSSIIRITGDMIVQPTVNNNAITVFFPYFKNNIFNPDHVFPMRVNCNSMDHTCPSLVKISAEMIGYV